MTTPRSIDQYRNLYRDLYNVFRANNLDATPFTSRLSGETDESRIREGIHAMRNFLIANGCMEADPEVRKVPEDNRGEYDLASREYVDDYLRSTPVRSRPTSVAAKARHALGTTPVADKFYMVGDTPMQAVKGRNGYLYARRRLPNGRWEYVKGAIFAIKERGRPASVEDIAAYGLASGQCFVCGKRLTEPKSVRAGIGPVCAKRVRS